MPLWEHYHRPSTVDQAIDNLSAYAGRARLLAGGTDLLLEMQQGRTPPVAAVVDITQIPEIQAIDEADGYLLIGAGVTHTAITHSAVLAQRATCLVESCGVIGGPQVRNVATLGGNVAHALPAGDGTLSLVALDAEAEIAGPGGREWRPIGSLYAGPGKSALDHAAEMIVRFRLRPHVIGEGSAFKRIMRPQGVALPILGLGVWVRVTNGVIADARVALGPAGPRPLRATQAEAFLAGQAFSLDLLPLIADKVLADAKLRTSPHRATAHYRTELILPLLARALPLAVQRATSGHVTPEGIGEG